MVAPILLIEIFSILFTLAESFSCFKSGTGYVRISENKIKVHYYSKFNWCVIVVEYAFTFEQAQKHCASIFMDGQLMTIENDANLYEMWREFDSNPGFLWVGYKTNIANKCWQVNPFEKINRTTSCDHNSPYVCQRPIKTYCAYEEKFRRSIWLYSKTCTMQILKVQQEKDVEPFETCPKTRIIDKLFDDDICRCMEKSHLQFDDWSAWSSCFGKCGERSYVERSSTKCNTTLILHKSCKLPPCSYDLKTSTVRAISPSSVTLLCLTIVLVGIGAIMVIIGIFCYLR